MRSKGSRLSTADLVEAFHLGHAAAALHELDVMACLTTPQTARSVARRLGVDPVMLAGVLDYVAARTGLLNKRNGRFAATAEYSAASRFLIDLYLGAFGGNGRRLPELLRDPSIAVRTVDRKRHARAFEQTGMSSLGPTLGVIEQLQLNHVLDIGCGPATLLIALAARNPDFRGWGLEANPSMRKVARARIAAAEMGGRVRLVPDRGSVATSLGRIKTDVQAVTACQVANEMFAGGTARIVNWLRQLRRVLPGRPLVISDYYGRLGRAGAAADRMTLLHDFVQLTSGQGVPPSHRRDWQKIYAQAGCRLVHVTEAKSASWFIHILVL